MFDPDIADGRAADARRPQDRELYAALLTFMSQRLTHVEGLLAAPSMRFVELEACALQVRLVLEELVLSTLVTNRPAAESVSSAFATKGAADARAIVKRVNPRYWPVPYDEKEAEVYEGRATFVMIEPSTPYLHEHEWGPAYGHCSTLIHAPNPYVYLSENGNRQNSEIWKHASRLESYCAKIRRLLVRHQAFLSERDQCFICSVPSDESERPSVKIYRRQPADEED